MDGTESFHPPTSGEKETTTGFQGFGFSPSKNGTGAVATVAKQPPKLAATLPCATTNALNSLCIQPRKRYQVHFMFAPVPQSVSPLLQIKKRRYEDECSSATESEDTLFFGEDAAVLHTRPRKIRRLRGNVSHKANPVQVPLATLASTSLQRGFSTSSAMEGVVDAPSMALHSHGPTPAHAAACEPTSQDWWFHDGDVVLAAGTMLFKVHSTVLAAGSGVFADLFALGSPEANGEDEQANNWGVPTIPVHDDANDWLEVLPWLYCGL